jgi:hypothetical protein
MLFTLSSLRISRNTQLPQCVFLLLDLLFAIVRPTGVSVCIFYLVLLCPVLDLTDVPYLTRILQTPALMSLIPATSATNPILRFALIGTVESLLSMGPDVLNKCFL